MVRSSLRYLVFGVLAVALLSFGSSEAGWWFTDSNDESQGEKKDNVVEVASEQADFSTFMTAIDAADLKQTLEGKGPFTIFAPTNEAFNKLGQDKLDELLKPENKEKLKEVLLYHVVPGKMLVEELQTMKVHTANGQDLSIKVEGSEVTVNGAKVQKADFVGSNGVIHVIDTVLIPQ